eukprot:9496613-Pyramimonas_sp.AAC.1
MCLTGSAEVGVQQEQTIVGWSFGNVGEYDQAHHEGQVDRVRRKKSAIQSQDLVVRRPDRCLRRVFAQDVRFCDGQ